MDEGAEPRVLEPTDQKRSKPARGGVWIGLAVVLATVFLLCEAKLWRPNAEFGFEHNTQIGEAEAWLDGRTTLPRRAHDTALVDGRVYSHFPPMFSFVAVTAVALLGGVPHWLIVALLALPVPVLAYVLFLRRTGSAKWATLLAIGLTLGSSAYPVIDKAIRGANPYYVNQLLGTIGVLILLIEYFGRRRVWVAGIGLIISSLSRQLTICYALPLAIMAWQIEPGQRRTGRIAVLALVGLITAGVPMAMNTIKFGHPLDSGYMYLYNDRPEDSFSRDARQYGIFSTHYVPRNLYYTNLGLPRVHEIEMAGEMETHLRPNQMGTGIWWTTPLLLLLFVDLRRIVGDQRERYLLIAAGLAFAALMFYHSTGFQQRGFNRYSLDYLPVLLALVAVSCRVGWRKWVSPVLVVWSVVYFRFLI